MQQPPPGPPGAPPPGAPGMPPAGYYPPPYPAPFPPPRKQSLLWLWILLGVVGVLMVIGILAAIAVPSFMEYQKKAKRSEAELNLTAIGRWAQALYAENAAFPTGSAEPTPPLGTCCNSPGHKCQADMKLWTTPGSIWEELDFQVDVPHYFSYSYEGSPDGQSFTAKAYGDLDCDGTHVEYVLRGRAVNGSPEIEIIKPTRMD